jgi:hypothetical protein
MTPPTVGVQALYHLMSFVVERLIASVEPLVEPNRRDNEMFQLMLAMAGNTHPRV